MKRAGCLLLSFVAVAPLATAAVYLLSPDDKQDGAGPRPTTSAPARPGNQSEAERKADDKVIASLPPGLAAPQKKDLAQQIVASAENSTLNWRGQYGYIEDIDDGQGYTASTSSASAPAPTTC